jgi:prepilin-type processing-associated H-X9-DG protein
LPAIQAAREAARAANCKNNIRQIAVSLHVYHDSMKRLPSGGDKRSRSKYSLGWVVHAMRHFEENNRRDVIDSFTTDAILICQPRRLTNPPHHGGHPIYLDPVPIFVCPSSELGSASPDATASTLPEVRAREQGALHYRAVSGRGSRVGDDILFPTAESNPFKLGTFGPNAHYATHGVIYGNSRIEFGDITDGTSKTLLLGETSSAVGRESPEPLWGGIQPWTWGYYYYGTLDDESAGWLTIDHKQVTYPIGYTGQFFSNETPFTSAHAGGGVHLAFCDGSVQFYPAETSLDVLQFMATRKGAESEAAAQ